LKTDLKLSSSAQAFLDSALSLRPTIAVFDCDGTLWSGDSGADFFYWEVKRGLLPPKVAERALARYDDYKRGNVGEEMMCGEMVTIHHQIPERLLENAAADFFAEIVEPRIFPEMLQLTRELCDRGCDLWAVSSTNIWVVREGVRRFGISAQNVLAACVHVEEGLATDRLHRVPSGAAKATALDEVLGKEVDVCFGNSIHDLAMLEAARRPFVINPNPDLEKIAVARNWPIYWPTGTKISR
jgi:phosphoserine phosphatase